MRRSRLGCESDELMGREERRKAEKMRKRQVKQWGSSLSRGSGLSRKTPMKRGTAQMKRVPIKTQSYKRRSENGKRAQVLAKLRQTRGGCEARFVRGCTGEMHDGHEVLTRGRGGSITDPDNILMVCRPCHTYITEHPREADCAGFTVPRDATPEMMDEARLIRELWRRDMPRCSSWCKVEGHKPNG